MSRGDPDRYRDEDDGLPRRRRSQDDDLDDLRDDPRPPRRPLRPGYGMGIAGLICGIVGVVLAVAGGGSLFCGICCIFLVGISWIIAAIGALVGALGIVFGLVSRSQGNPTSLPIWAITTGAAAAALAILAIVLPIVFAVNLPVPPPPVNNAPVQKQPGPKFNNPKRF
jgi:hypothetical protein